MGVFRWAHWVRHHWFHILGCFISSLRALWGLPWDHFRHRDGDDNGLHGSGGISASTAYHITHLRMTSRWTTYKSFIDQIPIISFCISYHLDFFLSCLRSLHCVVMICKHPLFSLVPVGRSCSSSGRRLPPFLFFHWNARALPFQCVAWFFVLAQLRTITTSSYGPPAPFSCHWCSVLVSEPALNAHQLRRKYRATS